MPKRNLAWLLALLLVVTAIWLLLPHGDPLNRPSPSAQQVGRAGQDLWSLLEQHYVRKFSDDYRRQMRDHALRSWVGALGDGYSEYIAPDEVQQYRNDEAGKFTGIGVELDSHAMTPTVATVVDFSPAFRAGMMPGDKIVSINGQITGEMKAVAAMRLIRGEPGKPIDLEVYRPSTQRYVVPGQPVGSVDRRGSTFSLERAEITRSSVRGFKHDDRGGWDCLITPQQSADIVDVQQPGVGYIRVSEFIDNKQSSTISEFKEALASLGANVNKLVLDLRNNPGGSFDQALKMADCFLPNGAIIVQERGAHRFQNHMATGAAGTQAARRIVVLVNGGSASGSEVVAGALACNRRAVLVGDRTYGKGTVQELVEFPVAPGETALVKLTAAYLYLDWGVNGMAFDRTEPPADYTKPSARPTLAKKLFGLGTLREPLSSSELERTIECRRKIDYLGGPRRPDSTTSGAASATVMIPAPSASQPESAEPADVEYWARELLKADQQLVTAIKVLHDQYRRAADQPVETYESLLKKAPTTAAKGTDEP